MASSHASSESVAPAPVPALSPAPASSAAKIHFADFEVTDQVFHSTPLCYALVNLKPLLPGHVLIIPHRRTARLTDLTTAETADIFHVVGIVQRMLAFVYFKPAGSVDDGRDAQGAGTRGVPYTTGSTGVADHTPKFPISESTKASEQPDPQQQPRPLRGNPSDGAFNVAIQDGADAKQSVPHVHVHIIPRVRNDGVGDAVYKWLEGEEGNIGGHLFDANVANEGMAGDNEGAKEDSASGYGRAKEDSASRRTEEHARGPARRTRPEAGRGAFPSVVDDASRKPRSKDVMNAEAAWYRQLIADLGLAS